MDLRQVRDFYAHVHATGTLGNLTAELVADELSSRRTSLAIGGDCTQDSFLYGWASLFALLTV